MIIDSVMCRCTTARAPSFPLLASCQIAPRPYLISGIISGFAIVIRARAIATNILLLPRGGGGAIKFRIKRHSAPSLIWSLSKKLGFRHGHNISRCLANIKWSMEGDGGDARCLFCNWI